MRIYLYSHWACIVSHNLDKATSRIIHPCVRKKKLKNIPEQPMHYIFKRNGYEPFVVWTSTYQPFYLFIKIKHKVYEYIQITLFENMLKGNRMRMLHRYAAAAAAAGRQAGIVAQ